MKFKFKEFRTEYVKQALERVIADKKYPVEVSVEFSVSLVITVKKAGTSKLTFSWKHVNEGIEVELVNQSIALMHKAMVGKMKSYVTEIAREAGGEELA